MKKQNPKGFAIVIVLVLISIMMSFAAGASLIATGNFKQVGRIIAATEAYYAAEGALEMGLLEMSTYGTGFASEDPSDATQVEIYGKAKFGANQALEDDCNLNQEDPDPDENTDPDFPDPGGQDPTGGSDPITDPPGSAGSDDPDPCEEYSEDENSDIETSSKWKLIGFSPQDLNHRIELFHPNPDDQLYYSIPVATSGNAGGELCAPGQDIPLRTTTSSDEGMQKFISDYNAKYSDTDAYTGYTPMSSVYTFAADHPCHWNKLFVSSLGGGSDKPGSVTIPLFIQFKDDTGANILLNPSSGAVLDENAQFQGSFISEGSLYSEGLGFDDDDEIFLRFRTPCKPIRNSEGEWINIPMCAPGERYVLDDTHDVDSDSGDRNNTVVAWEIEELIENPCGKLDSEGNCTNDEAEFYKIQHRVGPMEDNAEFDFNIKTTEIKESFINDAAADNFASNEEASPHRFQIISNATYLHNKYTQLFSPEVSGVQFGIRELLRDTGKTSGFFSYQITDWDLWKIYKPVLKFTLLHDLKTNDLTLPTENIPYLEYQILTGTDFHPFSDAHQTVIAEGFSRGLKQTIEVKIPQDSTVLQYAIQQ